MSQPLVTVGIALYNHQDFIVQCLESVTKQSYPNIEIIVIDDGSPDNSYQAAKKFLESQTDNSNFSVITRPNKGMCNTLNEIAKNAKGKYISFVGSDDYWALNKIEDQVAYLEAHPDITLVHSNSIKVDNDNNELKEINYTGKKNSGNLFEAFIYRTGGINTPSHLYRTEVYQDIGYYDPGFRFEDTDFWLRLSKNHQVGFIDKFHTYYRWHGRNLSDGTNALKFYNEELVRIYKKNIDDPELKRYAVKRMYKKSFWKAMGSFKLGYAWKYLRKLINLNKELASQSS
jgi:alpha-1,3-rhamnosyltransferase